MNKKRIIRYSESFKIEVVRDYEESGLTRNQISKKYGILGGQTLHNWIKKYGQPNSQNKIIRVEKPGEADRVRALEKEILELKKALADTHLESIMNKCTMEVACEILGITPEELKKKAGKK